jgi:hypothetical protein
MMDPAGHVATRPQPCGDRWPRCARAPWDGPADRGRVIFSVFEPRWIRNRRYPGVSIPIGDGLGVGAPGRLSGGFRFHGGSLGSLIISVLRGSRSPGGRGLDGIICISTFHFAAFLMSSFSRSISPCWIGLCILAEDFPYRSD